MYDGQCFQLQPMKSQAIMHYYLIDLYIIIDEIELV